MLHIVSSAILFSPVFCLTCCLPPSVALHNFLLRVEKAKERSATLGNLDKEFMIELVTSLVQNALDCKGSRFLIFSKINSIEYNVCDLLAELVQVQFQPQYSFFFFWIYS